MNYLVHFWHHSFLLWTCWLWCRWALDDDDDNINYWGLRLGKNLWYVFFVLLPYRGVWLLFDGSVGFSVFFGLVTLWVWQVLALRMSHELKSLLVQEWVIVFVFTIFIVFLIIIIFIVWSLQFWLSHLSSSERKGWKCSLNITRTRLALKPGTPE